MIREKEDPALQTPMMRQYLAVKERYSKEIIFFRMGDFYEMFFDDARVASEILGIALTSRSKDKDAIPMAGVPVRAVNSYLPRLLKAGKRVAICDQMEDPKDAHGLVSREVVKVISPGTITDERLVGEKSNNYICAFTPGADVYGIGWLDLTTGRFVLWESADRGAVCAQIQRLEPAECLLPDSLAFNLSRLDDVERALTGVARTPYPDPWFERDAGYRTLVEHFHTKTLEGFGCEHLRAALGAGGALLRYVGETQMASLEHISKVTAFPASRHVPIDRPTRHALELVETQRGQEGQGTVLASLDATRTAGGGRLLREWLLAPLTAVDAIQERLDAVGELVSDGELRSRLTELLREVHDVERIATRIGLRSANARDLVALRRTLEVMPAIRAELTPRQSAFLQRAAERLDHHEDLCREITRGLVDAPPLSIKEGGLVRDGYDAEVDELKSIAAQGTQWMARFQADESQRTGIPSLKVGYHQVFGYYIEVTNSHREKVPPEYIRKQTLKNCERFITPDLKEYEAKVLSAKDRILELEFKIFVRLREQAAAHIPSFQAAAQALGEVDVASTLASIASERGYVRPIVDDSFRLHFEDGRHPVVEQVAGSDAFVPNGADLDADRHLMIITGPNMAGKSTFIRQVAILTLLAQMGSFVPARSAQVGVVDRIFTRIGASDDLARGQSTFMIEMNETANILNNATKRSLIILDEVGRGTSTFDGVSLAWAITEHIANRVGARTLFATHYHELTALSLTFPAARNFNFAVKEWNDEIVFLRKIVEGASDKSYGIHVARLAGIPKEVLERAREILSNLESQSTDLQNRPALAAHRASPSTRAGGASRSGKFQQLDLFQDANQKLLKELKQLDTNSMTPLEALQYLAQLRDRVV
jgi:DNA mismatch repair protein MutS